MPTAAPTPVHPPHKTRTPSGREILPYHFDDAQRSVRILEPRLPQPWINYLSNGQLHAFVSQVGGGMAWWKSPLKNRLTRYRLYNLPIDSPGFAVYLRMDDGTVWSPAWRPAETALDAWTAEHLPGMTRFRARKDSIEATLELFIAPDTHALIWDLQLANSGRKPCRLDAFGYVEFSLLDWKQDTDWACYVKHNLETFYDAELGGIAYLYRHFHFNPLLGECPLVTFASSTPPASYCGDRDAFMGPYRHELLPAAVEAGHCSNHGLLCGDPCGALHHSLNLPAQGAVRLQYFLAAEPHAIRGWPRALEQARITSTRLRQPGEVDRLKAATHAWWNAHLGVLQADLPDPDAARQINTWNPVQSVHTARYSRSVSQHAAGVRTLGFRDTCQDLLAIAYRDPAWARSGLLYLLSQQYEDGHTPHQCNPVEQAPAEPRIHIDNPLWLPLLTDAVLAETGDATLLDEQVCWLDARDHLSPHGSASVWEHLLRIPAFIESHLGSHGIPLIHHGDWNDSIGKFGRAGRGESLMAAQQYVHALRLLAAMARVRREEDTAERLDALRTKQEASILACAWDGAWWRRGFDDKGCPIGSSTNPFGQIWLNTQTWAVIAGIGTPEQRRTAMDSVAARLDTAHCGIKKLDPSYPSFPAVADPYSGYSPGCGENGAIFCHANTWAVIAEAMLGRPDHAWHYYRQLIPHLALQKVGLHRYKAEPYAYVSNIIGPENPKYGWANVTQVTGTAAWMDIASTQYLLGLRPMFEGLHLNPCLPQDWEGFTARRRFRGANLEIQIRRGTSSHLELDGAPLPGNLVPADQLTGSRHLVRLTIPKG